MAGYAASTQAKYWTFTDADQLAAIRRSTYEAAIQRRDKGKSNNAGDAGDMTAPASKRARRDDDTTTAEPLNPLSQDETAMLLHHFEHSIISICKNLGFDRALYATAVVFFKRFYLYAAQIEYPPWKLVYPAIFLAIKTEACPYTEFEPFCEKLLRKESLTDADLVSLELPLLVGLRYHLTVYHPYRPLKALLVDMVTAYSRVAAGETTLSKLGLREKPVKPIIAATDPAFIVHWDAIQQRSFEIVDCSLCTDVCLLYSPSQIAAACLLLVCDPKANEKFGQTDLSSNDVTWFVKDYIAHRLEVAASDSLAHGKAPIDAVYGAQQLLLDNFMLPLDAPTVDDLVHRVDGSMNPSFVTGTVEFALRVAQRDDIRKLYKTEKPESRKLAAQLT